MLLKIEKMEKQVQQNKKGEPMEGLWIEGTKYADNKPPEKWTKFIMDWKDAQWIAVLEQLGVGTMVLITMKQNGRFWDITGVEKWRSEVPNSPTEQYDNNQQPSQQPNQTPAVPEPQPIQNKVSQNPQPVSFDFEARGLALTSAIKWMGGLLAAPERFKKLLKAATTPDLLNEMLWESVSDFENYLLDRNDSKAEANESTTEAEEPYQGAVDNDDDIPF